MEKLTERQEKVKASIDYLIKYMETYPSQYSYLDYSDKTIIDDVLYGLGIALGGSKYKFAQGFAKFKDVLRDHLGEE